MGRTRTCLKFLFSTLGDEKADIIGYFLSYIVHTDSIPFRIRINWFRIRIQHFMLNTNPEPDPDPGFWWPKLGKTLKLNFFYFLSKTAICYLSKLQQKPSPLKWEHPALQNMNFINFIHFRGSFLSSWIRIRLHWPNWIQIQSDPDILHINMAFRLRLSFCDDWRGSYTVPTKLPQLRSCIRTKNWHIPDTCGDPTKKTDEKNFIIAMLLIQIDPVFIWNKESEWAILKSAFEFFYNIFFPKKYGFHFWYRTPWKIGQKEHMSKSIKERQFHFHLWMGLLTTVPHTREICWPIFELYIWSTVHYHSHLKKNTFQTLLGLEVLRMENKIDYLLNAVAEFVYLDKSW